MTGEDIISQLKVSVPEELARDLTEQFISMRRDVVSETLERSSPGKFVESAVQILQYLERQSFDASPKVDEYLKGLESRQANLPDELRIIASRVARAMYTLRSKRGIAHKNGVTPNIYDLRYLYASAQWVMSELIAYACCNDIVAANHLVAFVQMPAEPLVEDFGERRLVLSDGTAKEELLILLRHYYPEPAHATQIHKDMDRRKPSTISHAISSARQGKLIEGNRTKGFVLTRLGYDAATVLVRVALGEVGNARQK